MSHKKKPATPAKRRQSPADKTLARKVDYYGSVRLNGEHYDVNRLARVGDIVTIKVSRDKVFHCGAAGKLTEIGLLEYQAFSLGACTGAANGRP